MSGEYFDFKQFRVHHGRSSMKVGTDGVLLGALVPVLAKHQRILDIGSGSGLIALILAQRNSWAQIDAVELDASAAIDARLNFSASPWFSRLNLVEMKFQEFVSTKPEAYDLIVSNPPFFETARSYRQEKEGRKQARYDGDLPWNDLLQGVDSCLKTEGEFYLILPAKEAAQFMSMALDSGWNLHHQINVYSKAGKDAVRIIMCLQKVKGTLKEEDLVLYNAQGKPTDAYIASTCELYLRIGN